MVVAACAVLGACAFEPGAYTDPEANGGTTDGGTATDVDAGQPPVLGRTCQYAGDGMLRLCLDFEDRQLAPKVTDASSMRLDSDSSGLYEQSRSNGVAAGFAGWGALIRVPESPALDLTTELTIELWVRPNWVSGNLVVNQQQYYLQLDSENRVTCTLGTASVSSSASVETGSSWSHVACTLTGGTMRVYVDGDLDGSRPSVAPLTTSGTAGTYVGPNYWGNLDDVRVYASALSATTICTHAGRTGCDSSGGGGGGG